MYRFEKRCEVNGTVCVRRDIGRNLSRANTANSRRGATAALINTVMDEDR